YGLADAGLAAERERGAELLVGLLRDLSEPADDPAIEIVIALGDVVADVGEKFFAFARAWLDRESAPEIVVALAPAGRRELDPFVLATLAAPQPDLTVRGKLWISPRVDAVLNRLVEMPRLERLDPDRPEFLAAFFEPHHRGVVAAGENEGVPLVDAIDDERV